VTGEEGVLGWIGMVNSGLAGVWGIGCGYGLQDILMHGSGSKMLSRSTTAHFQQECPLLLEELQLLLCKASMIIVAISDESCRSYLKFRLSRASSQKH